MTDTQSSPQPTGWRELFAYSRSTAPLTMW